MDMEKRLSDLLRKVPGKDAAMARDILLFMGIPNNIDKCQDACHIVMTWTCYDTPGRPFAVVRMVKIHKIVSIGLEAEMNAILSAFAHDGCA